jgi:hypothetical protein
VALEFTETFEGTLAAWGTPVGSPALDVAAAIHGTKGLKITGAGAQYLPRTPSPANPPILVRRTYLRVPAGGFPVGADATICVGRTAVATVFRIKVNVTTGILSAQIASNTVRSFGTLTAGTEYCIDYVFNATAGTINWWVDGVAQTQVTGTSGSTFSTIRLGNENGGVTAVTLHLDDDAQSQNAADAPIGPVGSGGSPGLVPMGMTSRLAGYSTTVAEHAAHPWLEMVSIYLPWKNVNTARGVFDWSNLSTSINDADTNNYKIILRVLPAIDASPAAPPWIFSDATNPVASLNLRTSAAATPRQVPVPWDANLRVLWRLMLQDLKTFLDGNNSHGHPRKNYIEWGAIAMPCFPGTEMWMVDEHDDNTTASGFPGTGNMAAWMGVSTGANFAARDADRTSKQQAAWDNAIDDMVTYLPTVRPNIACGAIFSDNQAKALAIPAARAATIPTLIGMETSARPNGSTIPVGTPKSITGRWKSWCGGCDNVIHAFINAGLGIGMQTGAYAVFQDFTLGGATPQSAFQYMARDMIGILTPADPEYATRFDYPLLFLEPNPALISQNEAYCRDVAQPAIMAQGSATNTGPPTPSWSYPPATVKIANTKIQVFFSDPDGVASAEYTLNGSAWRPLTYDAGNSDWEDTIVLNMGVNTLTARATDANASPLTSSPITQTVTMLANDGPPVVTIDNPPPAVSAASQVVQLNVVDADGVTSAEISLDNQASWLACTYNSGTGRWERSVTLVEGTNTIWARATDAYPVASSGSNLTSTPVSLVVTLTTIIIAPPRPPAPVPDPSQVPSLGVGSYQVAILARGGGTILENITGWTQCDWERAEGAISQGKVTIAGADAVAACCEQLAAVEPWSHELGVYRKDPLSTRFRRVWCGPILDMDVNPEQIVIDAYDLSKWLERRRVHVDHLDQSDRDLATLIGLLVDDALAPDSSMRLAKLVTDSGQVGRLDLLAGSHPNVMDEIHQLSGLGCSWTVVQRTMRIGGDLTQATPVTTLIDSHFVKPAIRRDGVSAGNDIGVRGQGVGDGADAVYGHSSDHAAITKYGLLEVDVTDDAAATTKVADAAAAQQVALYATPPIILTGGRLSPLAPITPQLLVPGNVVTVALGRLCVPVAGDFRIQTVKASVTAGAETVDVTLQPLGAAT